MDHEVTLFPLSRWATKTGCTSAEGMEADDRCGRTRARVAGSYYEIIGVASGAEAGEIKTAFRRLAKELHPDVNPSPEALQKFIEVTTAYVPTAIAVPFIQFPVVTMG